MCGCSLPVHMLMYIQSQIYVLKRKFVLHFVSIGLADNYASITCNSRVVHSTHMIMYSGAVILTIVWIWTKMR
jgi:hypothetical protein